MVVVDATLTVSDAKALRAQVDALKKPLLGVLLTHAHPDHYNGVATLIAGTTAEVYATPEVDQVARADDAAKEALWKPVFKDEWPSPRAFPSKLVRSGESVRLGGATFTVQGFGPGESHADSMWLVDGHAFIGDLVLNGVHAYLSDGHSTAWLANLDRAKAELTGRVLHPGHGASGGLELLDWQRGYLVAYRDEVKRLANGASSLTDAQKTELAAKVAPLVPGGKLAFLVPLGADAVAKELSTQR